MRRSVVCTLLLLLSGWMATVLLAQPPGRPPRDKADAKPGAPQKPISDDPKLMDAYRDFVRTVEGYANEYEKNKQPDKARQCYEEILRIIPEYKTAKDKVKFLTEQEYTADHKVFEVKADEDWQDTGISVVAGKPIRITASGTWTISYSAKVGPTGIEVPGGMRDMSPGELVGMIAATPRDTKEKAFSIGEKLDTTPDHAGHLFLRMFSPSVKQNTGKLTVQISGTFERTSK